MGSGGERERGESEGWQRETDAKGVREKSKVRVKPEVDESVRIEIE